MADMSGGFYSRPGGTPLGVRSGHLEAEGARPWEQPQGAALVEPRDRHVDVLVIDEWNQGLAVALRREGEGWRVRVAYVLSGVVREEWFDLAHVCPRVN